MEEDDLEQYTQMHEAATRGDWAEITKLVADGMELDRDLNFEWIFNGRETALSKASKIGDLECVQKLVEMGAGHVDESHCMEKYKYAMEMAAITEHFECFRFLVEHRLFSSIPDKHKYDVIIDECKKGDFDQILKLLDSDAYKDILNGWKGNNLMSLVLVYGCPPSCLQALIDHGVDVNGLDYNGFTPLMCAVLSRNVKCVQFLLHFGVNLNVEMLNDTTYFLENGLTLPARPAKNGHGTEYENWGQIALLYAACMKNLECLHEILPFCSENDVNNSYKDRTPLMFAAHFGNADAVTLLIKFGASPSVSDFAFERSALSCAIFKGHSECLKIMLEVVSSDCRKETAKSFDFRESDNNNCLPVLLTYKEVTDDSEVLDTLLSCAAYDDDKDSVRMLLEHGANAHVLSGDGRSLLMEFCKDDDSDADDMEMFDLFISRGVDVNVRDENGQTAMMEGAKNNAVKCAQKLMAHGADIHVKNDSGETPLMLACENGHAEFVNFLIKSGADVEAQNNDGNTAVAFVSSLECLQLLMEQGAGIHLKNNKRKTALMYSCEMGYEDVSDFYMKHGLDYINAQDEEGRTAIMYAAQQNHDKCLEILLANGADLDLIDKRGYTVFSFAMCGTGDCTEVLLRNGKILCGSVLNPGHKLAIQSMNKNSELGIKSLWLTMHFGIFEWEWFRLSSSLPSNVFTAVSYGISPGKFQYKDKAVSLLQQAFMKSDDQSIVYLLANRFFLPEDLKVLSTQNVVTDYIKKKCSEEILLILKNLTEQPLSLQTWSFLTISKALSLNVSPTERAKLVNALPLSDKMKRCLKFRTNMSHICPSSWCFEMEIEELFDNVNFRKQSPLDETISCFIGECFSCNGIGLHND